MMADGPKLDEKVFFPPKASLEFAGHYLGGEGRSLGVARGGDPLKNHARLGSVVRSP